MKTWKKTGLVLLFVIVIFSIWFYPKYKMLNHTIYLFDEDKIVNNFRSFDSVWPVGVMEASTNKYIYPKNVPITLPESFEFNGNSYESLKFLKDSWTTGFLVIQNDSIVFKTIIWVIQNLQETFRGLWQSHLFPH